MHEISFGRNISDVRGSGQKFSDAHSSDSAQLGTGVKSLCKERRCTAPDPDSAPIVRHTPVFSESMSPPEILLVCQNQQSLIQYNTQN